MGSVKQSLDRMKLPSRPGLPKVHFGLLRVLRSSTARCLSDDHWEQGRRLLPHERQRGPLGAKVQPAAMRRA
jgi:hypothetical protein